jgi:hypothetical protein
VIGGHVQGVRHGTKVCLVEGVSVRAGDQPGEDGARPRFPPGQPQQDALVVRAAPDLSPGAAVFDQPVIAGSPRPEWAVVNVPGGIRGAGVIGVGGSSNGAA